MRFLDAAWTAVSAVRAHLLRSLLTMLGIVIGVAAVIVVVAIGSGAKEVVVQQIRSLGSNLIIVDGRNSLWLSTDIAEDIGRIPGVNVAVPLVRGSVQIVAGNANWQTQVNGVSASFLNARDWPIGAGRNFTDEEANAGAKVVLLGQTVARLMFGDADPTGTVVRIQNVPFTIIGVLTQKGQSNTGRDQDDVVVLPIKTAIYRLLGANQVNPERVDNILVKVDDNANMRHVEKDIRQTLFDDPRLRAAINDDITIKNLAEVLQIKEASAGALAYLVGAIASVSLLVGGIGIMNIMLVSVIERTREIGIRMAVGAKRRDVMAQFLVESVTLSGLGGVLGLILGIIVAAVIALLADWPWIVSPWAIILAVGFSVTVGVLFGFYPARRAALLDPIEALRHE